MNSLKQETITYLEDLKSFNHVVGLKSEFGEEAADFYEVQDLKASAENSGLEFTIKISGCEAIGDLIKTQLIKPSAIVAPMIETPYAAKKFIESVKTVFEDFQINNIKLYINIETLTGFSNLNEIIKSDFSEDLSGIVFGRTDFTKSLGMNHANINSEIILDYAKKASLTLKEFDKEFILGGGISSDSISFLKQIPYLSKIETRNVIFDAASLLNSNNAKHSIIKSLEFEIFKLKNKTNQSKLDKSRLSVLENRLRTKLYQ